MPDTIDFRNLEMIANIIFELVPMKFCPNGASEISECYLLPTFCPEGASPNNEPGIWHQKSGNPTSKIVIRYSLF